MSDKPMANDKWEMGKIEFNSFINEQWTKLLEQAMGVPKERRKSMTVAELLQMLSKMPADTIITADDCQIKKVTAQIGQDGNIENINLEL